MYTPFVSIIIPVFNDCERLKICLGALEKQTYPHSLYEVIVVDNNSSKNIELNSFKFKQIKLGFEVIPGSYAARNRGITMADGEILAFTDSDCVPAPQWIESGVKVLETESADLVGGKVTFTFSPQKTLAEVYDSLTNMQIKDNIESKKVCKTANLFVKRHLFESVGLFPSHLKSGGDVIWTKKATDARFNLVYSPSAEVFHPARKLISLLKKQYRVGGGQLEIWLEQGQSLKETLIKCINYFRPPSPKLARKLISKSDINKIQEKLFVLWLIAWLCNTATNLGRLNSIFRKTIAPEKQNNGTIRNNCTEC